MMSLPRCAGRVLLPALSALFDFDRHCERSEAIQGRKERLDCFVAEPVIGRAFTRPVGSSQ
jgi:hypothetical protein